jgi:Family of unknown function (DUF5760)
MTRSIDTEYTKKITRWVELDNIAEARKAKLKVCLDEKKLLEESILEYVEERDMQNVQINLPDGSIKFTESKGYQGVSLKALKDNITRYFRETPAENVAADDIYNFIVKHREVKTKLSMKRQITS